MADTFKLSSDPFFVERVYDVAGLYLNPPEHAVVLCADEKSQVQAYPGDDSGVRDGRQQPALPVSPSVADGLSGGRLRRGQPAKEPLPLRPIVDVPFYSSYRGRVRESATCGNAVLDLRYPR